MYTDNRESASKSANRFRKKLRTAEGESYYFRGGYPDILVISPFSVFVRKTSVREDSYYSKERILLNANVDTDNGAVSPFPLRFTGFLGVPRATRRHFAMNKLLRCCWVFFFLSKKSFTDPRGSRHEIVLPSSLPLVPSDRGLV